ncbi:MAG: hypothetical protein A2Z19_02075 [Deltaproteobacteria bacterium RBG_16_54_18]|nr:MAG: hypothetical protein A2Z19_02075 [Deltaproteobacteria bacterium RBG_16_54_18]
MKLTIAQAESKFEDYRKYLRQEAQKLISYMSLYRHLQERKRDRLNEMNISPAFFQVTLDSLFSSIVLWVDKLFCEKSEFGFVNFLTFIEYNRNTFSIQELKRRNNYSDGHWMIDREEITYDVIEKDREKIRSIEALPSFKLRRDKFYAHFDSAYLFERHKLEDEAPLVLGDLTKIAEIMNDIINTYSTAYDGNIFLLKPLNVTDIDRILDFIHKNNKSNC